MSNRFDSRDEKTFKKNIKQAHLEEYQIAVRLCISVHSKTGVWPDLQGIGVDPTGDFIEKDSDVNASPDYKIGEKIVEITRSNVICEKIFHEKVNKVNIMTKNDSDMVFVNGFGVVAEPRYIWLSSSEWQPFIQKSISKYGQVPMLGNKKMGFINKPAYRFDIYWFNDLWQKLPSNCELANKKYSKIINLKIPFK